jgi:F0F1-type ATP synthase delta subunit
MKIRVESAISLSPAQTKALTDKLQQILGTKPTIKFVVNPDLLGGLKLVTQEKVIDLSIKVQLESLTDNLTQLT